MSRTDDRDCGERRIKKVAWKLSAFHATQGRRIVTSVDRILSPEVHQPAQKFVANRRAPSITAHKKGGVDLSAFHATQGRRIVTPDIRYVAAKVHCLHKKLGIGAQF